MVGAIRKTVLVFGVSALTMGVLAGAGGPAADAAGRVAVVGPSITATPNTHLLQEDQVTVKGSGFTPDGIAVIEFCPINGQSCRYSATTEVDGAGAFSVDAAAEFRTLDASGGPSDCNAEGCFIRASEVVDTTTFSATAGIAFDATQGPLPPQSFTVDPTIALRDHDTVHVNGTGFETFTQVYQCALTRGVCRINRVEAEIAANGSFTLDLEVRRFLPRVNRSPVDCATAPCVILAEALDTPVTLLTAPITFDPSAPFSPLPTLSVTPHANLPFESSIAIDGRHFLPGETVRAEQCKFESGFGPCRAVTTAALTADANGTVTATGTALRLIPDNFGGPTPTDCSDPAAICGVVLRGITSGDIVGTPIEFDATSPLPTMTVDPSTNLPFRAVVTVHGHHLTPNRSYTAGECLGSVVCATTTSGTSDAAGDLDLRVTVRRRAQTWSEIVGPSTVDCISAAVTCSIHLAPTAGGDRLSADITFDPNAAIPPPPTIAVVPALDLDSRELVSVTGSGFFPNSPVTLVECDTRPLPSGSEFCVGFTQTQSDSSGHIDATRMVQKLLSVGFGNPTDCSLAVGRCVLRAGPAFTPADASEVTHAPLGFDPTSAPPASPPVTVTPHTGLTDGQTVTVTGSRFTPDTLIAFAMCKAGTTFDLLDCEITNPTWFGDDATGAFTHTYNVRAHITTGHGAIDCTAAPGACVLGVVNFNNYSEFSLTPLSFGTGPHHKHHRHHHHKHHKHHHHKHHKHHHHKHHKHHHRHRG